VVLAAMVVPVLQAVTVVMAVMVALHLDMVVTVATVVPVVPVLQAVTVVMAVEVVTVLL
jgi:hypothetical protein